MLLALGDHSSLSKISCCMAILVVPSYFRLVRHPWSSAERVQESLLFPASQYGGPIVVDVPIS